MQNIELDRFRAALRIPSVWDEAPAAERDNLATLSAFQDFLAETFPKFHQAARRERLSPFIVLYRWPGRSDRDPVLLLAHYDVVPAEAAAWSMAPFGAELKDGFVWARGSLDTKCTLIAALTAAEALMEAGFVPERDVWFAFGGDEERSGTLGAQHGAAWFRDRGIAFAWALDEGSIVSEGVIRGVKPPLALIGVEEKGFLNVELTVDQKSGHSSRPPRIQAAAVLSRALLRINRKPFPWKLTTTAAAFFRGLSRFMPFPSSWVARQARLLGPLFFILAGDSDATAALFRTTIAMTQLEGSTADNVLPSRVKATLNLRLLPGRTVDSAIAHLTRTVADPRVSIAVSPKRQANDPVSASPEAESGPGWTIIGKATAEVFPNAAILPFLVTATTDSRHYASLCRAVYRFAPIKLDAGELARIHGGDERISVDNFLSAITFYKILLEAL